MAVQCGRGKAVSTIWLVTYYGRGESDDPEDGPELLHVREAFLHEGTALRSIAGILRDWVTEEGYVKHKQSRQKLMYALQHEQLREALRVWNEYVERHHDPPGEYLIGLSEIEYNEDEHPIPIEEPATPPTWLGEKCHPACLGFRISKMGEIIPCAACEIDDEEAHDLVQKIVKEHPPEKKDHPALDGCGATCRGWDVFECRGSEAIQTDFAILRSDGCHVFHDDAEAVDAACAFIHRATKTPYKEFLADEPPAWCSKCGAPIFFPEAIEGVLDDVCVECDPQRVMPWQEDTNCPACGKVRPDALDGSGEFVPGSVCPHCGHVEPARDDESTLCDHCGCNTEGVVPSVDYDNTLAETLGVVLCEPCGQKLSELPVKEAAKRIAMRWKLHGNAQSREAAERLLKEFA
jgi:ssDNA-binding Zn-finger/Zn-ribbon topoisomerase 1